MRLNSLCLILAGALLFLGYTISGLICLYIACTWEK